MQGYVDVQIKIPQDIYCILSKRKIKNTSEIITLLKTLCSVMEQ